MAITVSTTARSFRLTRKEYVKLLLGISASTDDELLDALIDGASAAIRSYCNREFVRQAYTETLSGFGGIHLMLERTPIVTVSAVSRNGDVVTDYSIAKRDAGWLYRQAGWLWDVQVWPGLSGGGGFLDFGSPLPRQEEPLVSVDYVAGYISPAEDIVDATTISAAAADNSFNDSAAGFPALLKAGDIVEASDFTNAANNGRFEVTGTPTASKIQVTASLTLEAAGSARSLRFRGHKDARSFQDVEKAAFECVKSWYYGRRDDSRVIEKQLGPARVRYSEQDGDDERLPPQCVGLLQPWVRRA